MSPITNTAYCKEIIDPSKDIKIDLCTYCSSCIRYVTLTYKSSVQVQEMHFFISYDGFKYKSKSNLLVDERVSACSMSHHMVA